MITEDSAKSLGLLQAARREQGPIERTPLQEGVATLRGRCADGSIDTSTTAGKIAVMQAYDRGERVQAFHREYGRWSVPSSRDEAGDDPCWDWTLYDYRIAQPENAVLARARRMAELVGTSLDDMHISLGALVAHINKAPAVYFGANLIAQCGLGEMRPGRYRLIRDDLP